MLKTIQGINMDLTHYPRIRCGHWPTPLEPMLNLSADLGGPELWVKRDDCTGLSTGGNKTRKLEYLIADAIAKGADTVITQGATQSNHARQTAALCAKEKSLATFCLKTVLGLKILLTDSTAMCCWIVCMARRFRHAQQVPICRRRWKLCRRLRRPR